MKLCDITLHCLGCYKAKNCEESPLCGAGADSQDSWLNPVWLKAGPP